MSLLRQQEHLDISHYSTNPCIHLYIYIRFVYIVLQTGTIFSLCHSLHPLLIFIVTSAVYLYLYILHYFAPPLMLECLLSLRDLTRTPDHNQLTPPSWMLSSSHSNADKRGTSLPSILTSPLSPLHRGTRTSL